MRQSSRRLFGALFVNIRFWQSGICAEKVEPNAKGGVEVQKLICGSLQVSEGDLFNRCSQFAASNAQSEALG